MLSRSLVREKIKDLDMTGHILDWGGSLGDLPRCGCREDNKSEGKERIQTQISLKRQLKGGK